VLVEGPNCSLVADAPDLVEESEPLDDLAVVAQEIAEQRQLAGLHGEGPIALPESVGLGIHHDIAERQGLGAGVASQLGARWSVS